MFNYFRNSRDHWSYRILVSFISYSFLISLIIPPAPVSAADPAPTVLDLPMPGAMVMKSDIYAPACLKGVKIDPENPLKFDFIIDSGNDQLTGEELEAESSKLIKYFLAALTIPEKDLWVNLSPYESDRIVPEGFSMTEMGRDLLAQDYMLKQLTASMIYPEDDLGQEFWQRVYDRAQKEYGTTNIPINTFNKIWIIPEDALVVEHNGSAFVVDSHLKVMLEEDYLALERNLDNKKLGTTKITQDYVKTLSKVSSDVVREVLLPEIEKEVNEGKNFANLRQIFNSLILATWYKENLRASLLGQVYVNKGKVKGVDVNDKEIKQKIYEQYLAAFKKGVYDYIREDYDMSTKKVIPRKYFSGGVDASEVSSSITSVELRNVPPSSPLRARIDAGMSVSSPVVQVAAILAENPSETLSAQSAIVASPISNFADVIEQNTQLARQYLGYVTSAAAQRITVDDGLALIGRVSADIAEKIQAGVSLNDLVKIESFQNLTEESRRLLEYASKTFTRTRTKRLALIMSDILKSTLAPQEEGRLEELMTGVAPMNVFEALETIVRARGGAVTIPDEIMQLYQEDIAGLEKAAQNYGDRSALADENRAVARSELRRERKILSLLHLIRSDALPDDTFAKVPEQLGVLIEAATQLLQKGPEVSQALSDAETALLQQLDEDELMLLDQTAVSSPLGAPRSIREDSLANFIHAKEDNVVETETGRTRTINFDDLFQLVSVYSEAEGTTSHEFFGYGITPIMMMKARAGDETKRDWRDILVELEDGINPDGIPYRDGVMFGNSYNQRMGMGEVLNQVWAYEQAGQERREVQLAELSEIRTYFLNKERRQIDITTVEEIDSGTDVTFGMALVVEAGRKKIVMESGFRRMIEEKGNPYRMLERSLVYTANQGTHEENRVKEYEYAKSIFPNVNKEIRVDVEQVFDNLVRRSLRQEPGRNEQLAGEWTRKVKESLWEIGVHMMNGEMQLQQVRWSEQDAEFTGQETDTGDTIVGVYASALNPLHFGQFEPVLRAMAQLKISQVGVVNHAFDYRKQKKGLNPTFEERDEMAQEWVDLFDGLLVLSKVLNGSEADGETKYKKLIEINGGRTGKTTWVYTAVGGDHMHVYAPSSDMDTDGYRTPKMDGDHPQPDTVLKMDRMKEELADHLQRNNIDMMLAFNFRELFESLPMPVEVAQMKEYMARGFIRPIGHINLFGTSSTNIREHFSSDPEKDITFLPVGVEKYILSHPRYRGWMTGLPAAIERMVTGEYEVDRDDIELFRQWMDIEASQGRVPTAAQISQYFTFRLEDLRKFNFTAGSLEDAERSAGVSFRNDLIGITEEDAARALELVRTTPPASSPVIDTTGLELLTMAQGQTGIIRTYHPQSFARTILVMRDNNPVMVIGEEVAGANQISHKLYDGRTGEIVAEVFFEIEGAYVAAAQATETEVSEILSGIIQANKYSEDLQAFISQVESSLRAAPVASPIQKILLVDDSKSILLLVSEDLKDVFGDVEVVTADNGQEALQTFRESGDFDLVVTDLQMPVMTGDQFTRELRAAGNNVPVVLLSGTIDDTLTAVDEATGLKGGLFDEVLDKPYEFEQLTALKDKITTTTAAVVSTPIKKILVVDDEEMVGDVAAQLFGAVFGEAEVIRADNGEEGLRVFNENPDIDLVVTDFVMPQMTGEQLAREIRAVRDLPIILTTGFAPNLEELQQVDAATGLKGGLFTDIFMKPYSVKDIVALKNNLGSSPLEAIPVAISLRDGREVLVSFTTERLTTENLSSTTAINRMFAQVNEQLLKENKDLFTDLLAEYQGNLDTRFMGWVLQTYPDSEAADVITQVLEFVGGVYAQFASLLMEGALRSQDGEALRAIEDEWKGINVIEIGGAISNNPFIRNILEQKIRSVLGTGVTILPILSAENQMVAEEAGILGAALLVDQDLRRNKVVIGVDVGGTSAKMQGIQFDENGNFVQFVGGMQRFVLDRDIAQVQPEEYYSALLPLINTLRNELETEQYEVSFEIGVGHPGKKEADGAIAQESWPNRPQFFGVNPASTLQGLLGEPYNVVWMNDAFAGATALYELSGQRIDNARILYIGPGTGLGAALLRTDENGIPNMEAGRDLHAQHDPYIGESLLAASPVKTMVREGQNWAENDGPSLRALFGHDGRILYAHRDHTQGTTRLVLRARDDKTDIKELTLSGDWMSESPFVLAEALETAASAGEWQAAVMRARTKYNEVENYEAASQLGNFAVLGEPLVSEGRNLDNNQGASRRILFKHDGNVLYVNVHEPDSTTRLELRAPDDATVLVSREIQGDFEYANPFALQDVLLTWTPTDGPFAVALTGVEAKYIEFLDYTNLGVSSPILSTIGLAEENVQLINQIVDIDKQVNGAQNGWIHAAMRALLANQIVFIEQNPPLAKAAHILSIKLMDGAYPVGEAMFRLLPASLALGYNLVTADAYQAIQEAIELEKADRRTEAENKLMEIDGVDRALAERILVMAARVFNEAVRVTEDENRDLQLLMLDAGRPERFPLIDFMSLGASSPIQFAANEKEKVADLLTQAEQLLAQVEIEVEKDRARLETVRNQVADVLRQVGEILPAKELQIELARDIPIEEATRLESVINTMSQLETRLTDLSVPFKLSEQLTVKTNLPEFDEGEDLPWKRTYFFVEGANLVLRYDGVRADETGVAFQWQEAGIDVAVTLPGDWVDRDITEVLDRVNEESAVQNLLATAEVIELASAAVSSPIEAVDKAMTKFNLKNKGTRELLVSVADGSISTKQAKRDLSKLMRTEKNSKGGVGQVINTVQRLAANIGAAPATSSPLGGIDLNPALLNLQIRRDGSGVPLPVQQQPIQNMNIEGFLPVIINITPIPNLPMLLGMSAEDAVPARGTTRGRGTEAEKGADRKPQQEPAESDIQFFFDDEHDKLSMLNYN